MKPFNLQKAIDGEPLETVTGHEVIEFHYFNSASAAISTHVAAATPNFLSCIVMLSRHVNQHLLEPSLLFRAPVCILLLNQ